MSARAILGLGSNFPRQAGNADASGRLAQIAAAVAALPSHGMSVVAQSDAYTIDGVYINKVVAVESELSCAQLDAAAKQIELAQGRTPQMRSQGLVPIDLDVVVCDGQVVRPRDFNAPYFQQGYQQIAHLLR